jgi:hypothetical protein
MRLGALALVAALCGCGTTMTAHAITGVAAPAHRRFVPTYLVGQAPPSNYAEVAVVQAIGRGDHANDGHVLQGLRDEAAALGCDAVLAVRLDMGTVQLAGVGVAVRWVAGDAPTVTRAPWSQPAAAPAPPPVGVRSPWGATPP